MLYEDHLVGAILTVYCLSHSFLTFMRRESTAAPKGHKGAAQLEYCTVQSLGAMIWPTAWSTKVSYELWMGAGADVDSSSRPTVANCKRLEVSLPESALGWSWKIVSACAVTQGPSAIAVMILRGQAAGASSSSSSKTKSSKGGAAVKPDPEAGEFSELLAAVAVHSGSTLWARPLKSRRTELAAHALRVQATGRLVAVAWSSGEVEFWSPLYGTPAASAAPFTLGQAWASSPSSSAGGVVDVVLTLETRAREPPVLKAVAAALTARGEISLLVISGAGEHSLLKEGASLAGSLGSLGRGANEAYAPGRAGEEALESVLAGMSGKHKRKLVDMDGRVARDLEQRLLRAAEADEPGKSPLDRYEPDFNSEAVQVGYCAATTTYCAGYLNSILVVAFHHRHSWIGCGAACRRT
jgi:hypothetical protein